MKNNAKMTIGRKDKADFPEFKLRNIDIKIDTGAFTSSIHCHRIELQVIEGKQTIKFELLDPSHKLYNSRKYRTEHYKEKLVKNSFGTKEKRYVILTRIVLFGDEYPIELSLSERGEMKYPVLIGRKLLSGRFIVDPARYNLSYREKRRELKDRKKTK